MSQFQQSANVKFMCKLGKITAEMLEILQTACWDSDLKNENKYDWHNCFKSVQEVLEEELHDGRPSTSVNAAAMYLPDLAPCDFWLFPRLKMRLQVKFFNNQKTSNTLCQPACSSYQRRHAMSTSKHWGMYVCVLRTCIQKGCFEGD